MVVEVVAGALCGAAGLMTYGVRGRSSSLLAPSVWRGVRSRSSVALTFDDGPSESTPELLEILERHHVRATFFQCGANVRRLPGVAAAVAAAGHEIGNHSDSHPRFDFCSPDFILGELARAQQTIEEVTGTRPVYFRPPYGVRWFGLRGAQRQLGLVGVMWTRLGRDWRWPSDRIARRLEHGVPNGAILLLHDGRRVHPHPDIRPTLDAVRRIIPWYLERGYQFETVSEILCPTT